MNYILFRGKRTSFQFIPKFTNTDTYRCRWADLFTNCRKTTPKFVLKNTAENYLPIEAGVFERSASILNILIWSWVLASWLVFLMASNFLFGWISCLSLGGDNYSRKYTSSKIEILLRRSTPPRVVKGLVQYT